MQLSQPTAPFSSDDVLNCFLEFLIESEIDLYDHQEEAILELFAGNNVILNTPYWLRKIPSSAGAALQVLV